MEAEKRPVRPEPTRRWRWEGRSSRMKPFSGFAAALMLATALAGATVGLLGTSIGIRVTMVSLILGACALGGSVLAGGHPRRFVLLAMVAFVVMGFFSWHLIQLSSPYPLRSLHVAALLAYGAVLLAAALRLLHVGDEARALLLAFSVAVPLFIADALVAPPRPPWLQISTVAGSSRRVSLPA